MTKRPPPKKPKKPGPIPKLLDPVVREKLLNAVKVGLTYEQAAASAGISLNTITKWLAKAREPSADEIYTDFIKALEQAQYEGLEELAARIYAASNKDWKAAAHLLACRYPEHWAKQERRQVELSGADDKPAIQIFLPDRGGRKTKGAE
jgi:transcriptional regulator with XRE-family HTH domain